MNDPVLRLHVAWAVTSSIVLALSVSSVFAHGDDAPKPVREIIRIQGYRSEKPADTTVVRVVKMTVLGDTTPFYATEWQRFSLTEKAPTASQTERTRFALQGSRPILRKVSQARSDQRVTILAEGRPLSSDLFLLSVDLCPE